MSKLRKPKVLIIAASALALLVISVLGGGLGEALGLGFLAGPLPFFSVAAETIFYIGGFAVTNSMITLVLVALTLAVIAFFATRRIKEVPTGMQNLVEAIIDFFGNIADNMGKGGRVAMAIAIPIFLLVVISNWFGLLPIVGSIGRVENVEEWLEHRAEEELHVLEADESMAHLDHEYLEVLAYTTAIRHNGDQQFAAFDGDSVATIPLGRGQQALVELGDVLVYGDSTLDDIEDEIMTTGHLTGHALEEWEALEKSIHDSVVTSETESSQGEQYDFRGKTAGILIPYFRAPSTDLNFTLALAIIAMGAVQVLGVRSIGLRPYLGKFFAFRRGPIWTFVGLLELLSEFSRVISFTIRLFGNIFAGEVLLFVLAFLLPLIGMVPFLGLELFVGMIQGFIFAMLVLVFSFLASQAHGDEH